MRTNAAFLALVEATWSEDEVVAQVARDLLNDTEIEHQLFHDLSQVAEIADDPRWA